MQGQYRPQSGRRAAAGAARSDPELSLKRFILERTDAFAHEPNADLYRVNLLGQMLDRYDELRASGASEELCVQRVCREFADIPRRMAEAGFERAHAQYAGRPPLTEAEADAYLRQSAERARRNASGAALCAACCAPLMAAVGFYELGYAATDALGLVGLIGMFVMIALGVYRIATARKPDRHEDVKRGRFSLSLRLRKKLSALRERMRETARKRRATGIALCVACVIPIFAGAAMDMLLGLDVFATLGVSGMFLMIGAGVYEIVAADGEKKAVERLLRG